jgi:hypothetical protein
MMTGTLTLLLPMVCSLLFGIAALAGGATLLAQNKERGIAIGVLAIGVLCILASLGLVIVYIFILASTRSM